MTNVVGTRIAKVEDFFPLEESLPGAFCWRGEPVGRLMFMCPCGCAKLAGVTVKPVAPQGWDWNGNLDKPTLSPSILIDRGHWHGYLTDGVFKSC